MKKPIGVLLILVFISTLALAERSPEEIEQILKTAQYNSEKRDPDHAAFWGFIPGGGQVYNKEYLKAVGMYGLILVSALASFGNSALAGLTLLAWTYSIYDARASAENYNKELKKKYGLSAWRLMDTGLSYSIKP